MNYSTWVETPNRMNVRFLNNSKAIESALNRLIRRCSTLRWAVAWASYDFRLLQTLKENQSKIKQLTAGLHFYQTDPRFIQDFKDHPNVNFVLDTSGVFHPKLYFFENPDGSWDAIVGSANFTKAAFQRNTEMAFHISGSESEVDENYNAIVPELDGIRDRGKRMSESELEAYSKIRAKQKPRLDALAGTYTDQESARSQIRPAFESPLFRESWDEYVAKIREDPNLGARLDVLTKANELFNSVSKFSKLSDEDRARIGGFPRMSDNEWVWFGSMRGAGLYKQAINRNIPQITEALAAIPLYGEVTEGHFKTFVSAYQGSHERSGISGGTRLLSMKRPDYFVCCTNRNTRALARAFDIPHLITLENYWDQIVRRLIDSNWWLSECPAVEQEAAIWNGRAALLDSRFYER